MSIKLSILVPTLGSRKVEIKRLFDSLMEQTYNNLEIITVVQGNFELMRELCDSYLGKLNIIFITMHEAGLSKARNLGLKYVSGDIIILSDDDCWYNHGAMKTIVDFFDSNSDVDVLLTQIYDPIAKVSYKNYPPKSAKVTKPINLLSKSSIEIAFKKEDPLLEFDNLFGLGGRYVAGEENDYLIRLLKNNRVIQYEPIVTVFHEKKINEESNKQLVAKGALYSKNFGFFISNIVLLRDLLIKHQNNYRWFWNGYFDYKKYD